MCKSNEDKDIEMKTMNCKQLGGACDEEFHANTFEEMAELSKQHCMDMFKQQESAHLAAMQKMQELMKNPEEMKNWFESKREQFEAN
jgi:hypothetical protein